MSDDPLARRPSDTPKSWRALQDYAAMGPGRSLEKYRQITGKSPAFLRQLERWSAAHDWQTRVALYDENLAAAGRAEREAQRAAWAQRHMGKEEVLALLSDQARGSMADFLTLERTTHTRPADGPWEDMDDEERAEHADESWVEEIDRYTPRLDLQKAKDAGLLHLVKKLKWTKHGPEIELYDAQGAQKLIGQHHRLFVERHEVTGADGQPLFKVYEASDEFDPDSA